MTPRDAAGRPTAPKPVMLLFEPFFVLRHTVAAVARELGLAHIVEATTFEGAMQLLERRAFDACLVAVDDQRLELELVQRLRAGGLASAADTPVAVTTAHCDAGMVLALREMNVSRIVLKPFKVRTLLDTVAHIVADRATAPTSGAPKATSH